MINDWKRLAWEAPNLSHSLTTKYICIHSPAAATAAAQLRGGLPRAAPGDDDDDYYYH